MTRDLLTIAMSLTLGFVLVASALTMKANLNFIAEQRAYMYGECNTLEECWTLVERSPKFRRNM